MPAVFPCPAVEDFEKVLHAAVPVSERESLLRHAAECDRCAETVEQLMATDTLIDAIPLQSPAAAVVSPVMVGVIERMCALSRAFPETATSRTPDRTAGEGTEQVYDFLAPPQAADEIGRLGPYRVLQVLGIGGMGVVFQAEDPQIQRQVALKVMKPGLAASATGRQRFLQEARAAGALVHDHIVTVYHVGEDRGIPFLAMPLLQGASLGDRLERQGRLPVAEVLRIGREVAEGLAAAHAHGLIHRDVKPGNIWLEGARGRVKLLDFGLARAPAVEAALTHPGTIVGTPAYMAPEQARGGAVDARADLFSLGCVLYRAATGRVAFQGADALATLAALAVDNPPPPHALNPALSPALSDLILRLLAKDPAGRPASAREVSTLLQSLETDGSEPRAGLPREMPPAKPAAEYPAPPPTCWWRSRILIVGVLLGAAVGAALALSWHTFPPPHSDGHKEDGRRTDNADLPIVKVAALLFEGHTEPVSGVVYSRDGRLLLSGGFDNTLRSWDARTGRELHVFRGHTGKVRGVALSADGKMALSAAEDRTARVWNVADVQQVGCFREHSQAVRCVAFSPDGKYALSASKKTMRLWDVARVREVRSFPRGAESVAFSPDGRWVVSGGWDNTVFLWDRDGACQPRAFPGHKKGIKRVTFTPDGQQVLSGSEDCTLVLWDIASGKIVRRWRAHQHWVWDVAFSVDGHRILSAGWDRTARLWDAAASRELQVFAPGAEEMLCGAIAPDGRNAVCGCADGVIRLWRLPP